MKESCREGIANHSDPESCGPHREVRREALTGAQAGWVLSFESNDRERRRCQVKRKATRTASPARDAGRLPGVGDPTHAGKLVAREPGDPGAACGLGKRRAGGGTQKGTPFANAAGKSDHCVVCAEQRVDREGSSPSGARMRSAVSERGGNASRAGREEGMEKPKRARRR